MDHKHVSSPNKKQVQKIKHQRLFPIEFWKKQYRSLTSIWEVLGNRQNRALGRVGICMSMSFSLPVVLFCPWEFTDSRRADQRVGRRWKRSPIHYAKEIRGAENSEGWPERERQPQGKQESWGVCVNSWVTPNPAQVSVGNLPRVSHPASVLAPVPSPWESKQTTLPSQLWQWVIIFIYPLLLCKKSQHTSQGFYKLSLS